MFQDIFPYYLAIGMSYNEFWYGRPGLARDYRKAYDIKVHNEEWARHRQGMYVMQALRVVMSGFAKDKSNPETYPKEPWPLTEKEDQERQQREARERYYRMREKLFRESKQHAEEAKKEAVENG